MNKYSAKKTECATGHIHDSRMEASRCDDLTALTRLGSIQDLMQQPKFRVEINGKLMFTYIADFSWRQGDCQIVEDVKGMVLPIFNLKKKLVEATHPGVVITIWPPRKRKARKAKGKAK